MGKFKWAILKCVKHVLYASTLHKLYKSGFIVIA